MFCVAGWTDSRVGGTGNAQEIYKEGDRLVIVRNKNDRKLTLEVPWSSVAFGVPE